MHEDAKFGRIAPGWTRGDPYAECTEDGDVTGSGDEGTVGHDSREMGCQKQDSDWSALGQIHAEKLSCLK